MARLDILKQGCLKARPFCSRQLSLVKTEAELRDFVIRRQISIAGFSPQFEAGHSGENVYRALGEARFDQINTKPAEEEGTKGANVKKQSTDLRLGEHETHVRDLVLLNIGEKWKWFARDMGFPEAALDALEHDYSKMDERIMQLLRRIFSEEENPLPRIKAALEKVGRRDLAIQIKL